MIYLFKKNKLYKFNEEIIIIQDYFLNDIECCVDEASFKLLDALPEKDKIVFENNMLTLGKTKIKTFETNKIFPTLTAVNEFDLDLSNLKEASKFIDKKSLRAILTGVYVNDLGTLCATDSFKLYYLDKGEKEDSKSVILSQEFVKELSKYNSICKLKFNDNTAWVEVEGKIIIGRLLQGKYPEVRTLVNNALSGATPYEINKKEYVEKMRIGSLVGGEKQVLFEDNEMIFKGLQNQYSTNVKEDIKILVRFDFLQLPFEILENITMHYKQQNAPLLFTEDNKKILILPMRLIRSKE